MAKVIIEAISTPNIWHFPVSVTALPELRIYANENFISDGEQVLAGDPQSDGPHLKIPCEMSGANSIVIPSFEIDSTPLTLPFLHTSRYTAILRAAEYEGVLLEGFAIPPEPQTMNWDFLRTYQYLGRRFSHGPMAEHQAMVTSMITDALTFLRYSSETQAGMAALTANPIDPIFPIGVGANDPNWLFLRADAQARQGRSVVDANATGYGARPFDESVPDNGERIAAAAQDALADALAHGKRNAVVQLDPGLYWISNNLSTAYGARAQTPIPKLPYNPGGNVHLTIECKTSSGYTFPGWLGPNDAGAGVVLASTLTGLSYSAQDGAPFIMGGPDRVHGVNTKFDASWIVLHTRGISFRVPANPSIGGFNGELIAKVKLEGFRCHAQVPDETLYPTVYAEPTNPTGIANLMPMNGLEGGDYIGAAESAGMFGGLAISELTNAPGPLFVYSCKVPFNLQTPWYHGADIGQLIDTRNVYGLGKVDPVAGVVPFDSDLAVANRTALDIDMYDAEDATTGWNARIAHLNDPASRLVGRVQFLRVIQNLGTVGGLSFPAHHARNLELVDLTSPEYQPDLITDRLFGQAGKALTTRRPLVNQGSAWELPGVSGAETYTSWVHAAGGGSVGSGAQNSNVVESNVSNGVVSALGRFSFLTPGSSMGLIFRYVNPDNYWLLEWLPNTGNASVLEKTGANTYVTRTSSIISPVAGRFYTLAVVLADNIIKAYVDGQQVGTDVVSASYQTATKHGIYASNVTVLMTNFRVTTTL